MIRLYKRKVTVILLSMVLAASTVLGVSTTASAATARTAAAEPVVPLLFSPPEDIGPMVTSPNTTDAVFGIEDGKQVMYTTVSGNPALFNVIDIADYSLIRTVPLPQGGGTGGHAIDAEGQVYILSLNGIYRYSPVTKQAERLVGIPGAGALYGPVIDEHGNVYGGTFSTGSIFKYDPAADKLTVFDRLSEGKDYVKSIAYYEGYLYAGTGAIGEFYKVDPNTGSKMLIPFPDVPQYTDNPVSQLYTMTIVRNYMFILTSAHNLLIYDLAAQAWLPEWSTADKLARYFRGMSVSPELNGKVYLGMEGKIQVFDLETLEITPTAIDFTTYLRQPGWVEMNDPDLPGKSLVTILTNGGIAAINITNNIVKSFDPLVPGTPVSIQSLELGPDGLLYSAGYLGTYGARYNMETGDRELFNMGQSEGMVPYGDKMMFGVYPAANIYELDTTHPIERNINPKKIHQIGDEQDRPFVMVTGDDMLFTGTIPKLGQLGGALTTYDGSTWETHRNVVQNQSIMGLAYRAGEVKGEGLVYGSTSVWGGLGIEPSESEAKMFVWDVKTKQVIKEFTPDIAQVGGVKPKAIGALSFGPDGLLWGAAYGTVFAMDPDTYEIVKQKEIHRTSWVFGHYWVPAKLRWANNGFLYTTLGGAITVMDPETMAHVTIPGTKANLMVAGEDGNIYYSEASVLKKITVTPGEPPAQVDVEIPIVNSGFEEVNHDGTIPGWEQSAANNSLASNIVTNENSKEGNYSLKLTDTSNEEETGTISIPFPVQAGLEYSAKSDVFLEEGRAIYAMRYYDAEGVEIKLYPAPASYIDSPHNVWTTAEFKSMAPEGAVTGKLVIFISKLWVGTAYFDNLSIVEQRIVDSPSQGAITQYLEVINPGFEQPLDGSGTIPGWNVQNPQTLVGKDAAISLSSEIVKSGNNSLFLYDNVTNLAVAVDSDLIPVEPGQAYTVNMAAFRTDPPAGRGSNRPIIQVRYHDSEGKVLPPSPLPVSKEITAAANSWVADGFTSTAPANASYLRVILIGASAYVASIYVDDVTVTRVVSFEDRTTLALTRAATPSIVEGEDATFTVTAKSGADIIVKDGLDTVARAIGAGEEQPVTVTIPTPAVGDHSYEVYANVPGLGKSDTIILPLVTVYGLTDFELNAEGEVTLLIGEEYPIYAKAIYGSISREVTSSIVLNSEDMNVVAVSDNIISGMMLGQVNVTVSLGSEAIQLSVIVTTPEDVDGNAEVNVRDLTAVANQNGDPVTDENRNLDVNGDGEIDSLDIRMIRIYINKNK